MLLELILIVLVPLAGVGLLVWLERRLRQPGLCFLVMGVSLGGGAVYLYEEGNRLIPVLLGLQVPGQLYLAWWRHTTGRSTGSPLR